MKPTTLYTDPKPCFCILASHLKPCSINSVFLLTQKVKGCSTIHFTDCSVQMEGKSVDVDLKNVMTRVRQTGNWSDAEATEVEREYRRFLQLRQQMPKLMLVPSPKIDDVWHSHILFTQQYAEDCNKLFGEFL